MRFRAAIEYHLEENSTFALVTWYNGKKSSFLEKCPHAHCIQVAWGVVMTLMGLCQSYAGLLTARCFLGITEAGLFPGVVFYLTMWYTRYEYQWRMALFFSAVGVAGAFSGLLAYGISFMGGVGGLNSWRWIFILEVISYSKYTRRSQPLM